MRFALRRRLIEHSTLQAAIPRTRAVLRANEGQAVVGSPRVGGRGGLLAAGAQEWVAPLARPQATGQHRREATLLLRRGRLPICLIGDAR